MASFDSRRFWNPSLPQTLTGAMFLLYANVAVALLYRSGGEGLFAAGWLSLFARRGGASSSTVSLASNLGNATALVALVGSAFAAYLIANERKRGWQLGVFVAAIPVVASLLCLVLGGFALFTVVNVGFLFDVALFALLLHPQSKDYIRIWFK